MMSSDNWMQKEIAKRDENGDGFGYIRLQIDGIDSVLARCGDDETEFIAQLTKSQDELLALLPIEPD